MSSFTSFFSKAKLPQQTQTDDYFPSEQTQQTQSAVPPSSEAVFAQRVVVSSPPNAAPQNTNTTDSTTTTSSTASSSSSTSASSSTTSDEGKQPLVSLIVTIFSGSSYDPLFRQVPQVAPDGRVSVFQINPAALKPLLHKISATIQQTKPTTTTTSSTVQDQQPGAADSSTPSSSSSSSSSSTTPSTTPSRTRSAPTSSSSSSPSADSVLNELIEEMKELDADRDSVVFNWECCSSWSSSTWGPYRSITFQFLSLLMKYGYMAMISDFALKALIQEWDTELLGPNPFLKIGEFGDSFDLRFNSDTLRACESSQLQKVGELCDNGQAHVHALGGTIAYTLNDNVVKKMMNEREGAAVYQIKVLTIATKLGSLAIPTANRCHIGEESGAAGHILLSYRSGGSMLLSAGHWIELSRLDTSLASVMRVAEQYGQAEQQQLQAEIADARSVKEREDVVQSWACRYVQQSAPAKFKSKSASRF